MVKRIRIIILESVLALSSVSEAFAFAAKMLNTAVINSKTKMIHSKYLATSNSYVSLKRNEEGRYKRRGN
jgi:hypothetical protein